MREVTQGDIQAAARVLMACPVSARRQVLARMLARAHAGDCYRKARGRIHPGLGNGTLLAAAQMQLPAALAAPLPRASDPEWLACVAQVILGLLDWRHARQHA